MSGLNFDIQPLFSASINFDKPNKKLSADEQSYVQKTFETWTQANSEIYSGYRKRALECFGLKATQELAANWRGKFNTLIVLGIGGSALGTKCVYKALEATLDSKDRKKLIILDNLDPIFISRALSDLDLKQTGVAVITKSGGTIETMAQCSMLIKLYQNAGLDFKKHFVGITDPNEGALRAWIRENHLSSLEVPSDVGGRFSVFTPVGLFALAFAGISIEELLKGANDEFNSKTQWETKLNLAHRLWEFDQAAYSNHVLMPYSTQLKEVGEWFVQLWGESLGKPGQSNFGVGTAPMGAVGATDQHSLLQLLMEGPKHFVSAFIRIKNWSTDFQFEDNLGPAFKKLSFAFGKNFSNILNAELQATKETLLEAKRPVYEIQLESLDAYHVGALLAAFMDLTTISGIFYEINPFDQPGVEAGKIRLAKLLGNK